jgi:hypothetical protein
MLGWRARSFSVGGYFCFTFLLNSRGISMCFALARNAVGGRLDRGLAPAAESHGAGMEKRFKVGDHVTWNSEAGRVSGRIVKVHTKDVNYKNYVHHASKNDPQYEIKSDKTDHVALHKGAVLKLMRRC